jgi:hypothetical protein
MITVQTFSLEIKVMDLLLLMVAVVVLAQVLVFSLLMLLMVLNSYFPVHYRVYDSMEKKIHV